MSDDTVVGSGSDDRVVVGFRMSDDVLSDLTAVSSDAR